MYAGVRDNAAADNWDPLFALDVGLPLALCSEGPTDVFSRRWSKGTAKLDCRYVVLVLDIMTLYGHRPAFSCGCFAYALLCLRNHRQGSSVFTEASSGLPGQPVTYCGQNIVELS